MSDCIHTTCSTGAELHCVDGLCTCNSPQRSKHYTKKNCIQFTHVHYSIIPRLIKENVKIVWFNLAKLLTFISICKTWWIFYSMYIRCVCLESPLNKYRIHSYRSLIARRRRRILQCNGLLTFMRGSRKIFWIPAWLCFFFTIQMATCVYKNIRSFICWANPQKFRYTPAFKLYISSVCLVFVAECITRDDCLAITDWNCREQDRHCVDNLCVCGR